MDNDTPNNANTQRLAFFQNATRENYARALALDPVAVAAYEKNTNERLNDARIKRGLPTV